MSDEVTTIRQAMPTLAPQNFHDALTFSKMLSNSSFVPKEFRGKPDEILAAIQYGFELGVGPMQALQNIAVINGKPSVYGDLALALVQASGKLEYIVEHDDGVMASCNVKRVGSPKSHLVTFSNEDAKRAGLLGKSGPWTQYPARMRQFRARGFALRDVFADVLKGLITREEAEDYPARPGYDANAPAGDSAQAAPLPEDENQAAVAQPNDLCTLVQRKALLKVAKEKLGDTPRAAEWLKERMASGGIMKGDQLTVLAMRSIMAELLAMGRGEESQEADIEFDKFLTAEEQQRDLDEARAKTDSEIADG